jgi:hypothetical protein
MTNCLESHAAASHGADRLGRAEIGKSAIRPHTTIYLLADANRALQDLKNDRISGTAVLTIGDG